MSSFLRRHGFHLILTIFFASVLLQGGWLILNTQRDVVRIIRTIGKSSTWRSAYFNGGKQFADYIEFLNETIPADEIVVIPTKQEHTLDVFSRLASMQFFLMPRQVVRCGDVSCFEALPPERTYYLAVDGFPGLALPVKMMNDEWGIVLPQEGRSAGISLPDFTNFIEIFWATFWPVVWLLMIASVGYIAIQILLPGQNVILNFALGYGLGTSTFSLIVALFSLGGGSINRQNSMWITAVLIFVALGLAIVSWLKRGVLGFSKGITGFKVDYKPRVDIWLLMFVLLGTLAAIVSVGKGYSWTDEILLWGNKGYGIAYTGSLRTILDWGTNTLRYPLHIPILIAVTDVVFDDLLPASKLIFPGYYLCLMLIVYDYLLVTAKLNRTLAGLATLLIGTAPVIFFHGTLAYSNLPLAYYLVSAGVILTSWFASPEAKKSWKKLLLSGLFFAFAAWTRPEAAVQVALGILLILAIVGLKHWAAFTWSHLLLLLSPLVVYEVFWYVFKTIVYSGFTGSDQGLIQEALSMILSGGFHLNEAIYIVYYLFKLLLGLKTLGILGYGIVVFSLIGLLRIPRQSSGLLLIVPGLLYVILMMGMYYITSFSKIRDISFWVSTGMDRMLIPGLLMLWVGGVAWLGLTFPRKN